MSERPYDTESGLGEAGRVTSKKAAVKAAGEAASRRAQCFSEIAAAGAKGRTADEVAEALGLSPLSVRPRITELSNARRISAQNRPGDLRKRLTRPSSTGSPSLVWVIPRHHNGGNP